MTYFGVLGFGVQGFGTSARDLGALAAVLGLRDSGCAFRAWCSGVVVVIVVGFSAFEMCCLVGGWLYVFRVWAIIAASAPM